MKYLILLLLILSSCSDGEIVTFNELPIRVKILFSNMIDKSDFVMCEDTNPDCDCLPSSAGVPNFYPLVKLESCDKNFYTHFTNTSLRIYVIDEGFIYYPKLTHGFSIEIGKPLSTKISLDTLNFVIERH